MNVVIVGGGFGGVKAAKSIARDRRMKVTLISDEPYFLYHATLYSVATGHNAGESVISLGRIFADYPNVTVVHDRITAIDATAKTVRGKAKYHYDELVLALGAVTTYFGIPGIDRHAYGIKTLQEVERFKQHIYDEVIEDKKLDRNYVVVGAGPTGVEFASALNTYLRELIIRTRIKKTRVNVLLVEAAPRILPKLSATASKKVLRRLEKDGVTVRVGQTVEAMDDDTIQIDGRSVPSHTVVWTSGVAQNPLLKAHLDLFKLSANGRVIVDRQLRAAPSIYVLGDNAATKYAGLATTALTDGAFIGRTLRAKAAGRVLPSYHPIKYPDSVPVDASWAYVERFGIYISGRFGAVSRSLLELQLLSSLLGFTNAIPVWRARDLRDDGHARELDRD